MITVFKAVWSWGDTNRELYISRQTNVVNHDTSKDTPSPLALLQQVLQLWNCLVVELQVVVLVLKVVAVVKSVRRTAESCRLC